MSPRDYLASLEFHGIKLGLENIQLLLRAAGNPQHAYPTLHVAGTNGKGSVVAFLASILRAAGYRVGRFTSPHLIDVTERFLVDDVPISNAALEENIEYFRTLSDGLPNPPTDFELCTAIAFRVFEQQKVDVAIIEVGMGGRYDSTNVVAPLVSVITNIAFDHQKYLGDTLAAIAAEKAGIIKPGVPVVTGERWPEAFDVIAERAVECSAPLVLKGKDFTYLGGGEPLAPSITYRSAHMKFEHAPLGLAGLHQVENAALAVAALEQVRDRFPAVSEAAIIQGLADARWPCRLERVLDDPPVYIDVAHNPAGIARLVECMPPCTVVFSASADKDGEEMLARLAPIAARLILTRFEGPRATSTADLARSAHGIPHEVCETLDGAIQMGLETASISQPLLITGSIFAAGQARQILIDSYGGAALQFHAE
ncbi:MAG TPA: folylpolyglutamate synthase/dihydrofolate synthase family protein [Candidatus Hydrogenedentes bacterium]|nr:folylpolyglutamate synthase/dihydrofolate synthase family protein [Candidatus Hydrogenedentota bacterium]